jgi:antitoxin (DNA-binding transcriptional repressor) of toxin-antitoxin stability system
MAMVTLEEAQRRLPELIATTIPGDEILILQDDRVVARLVTEPRRDATPRRPGSAKGSILYMAEDFDAPLDEFREYME